MDPDQIIDGVLQARDDAGRSFVAATTDALSSYRAARDAWQPQEDAYTNDPADGDARAAADAAFADLSFARAQLEQAVEAATSTRDATVLEALQGATTQAAKQAT